MSTKAEKLLERMRASQAGWKRNDLDRLYEGYGFIIIPGGNHDKVYHPDFPQLVTSLPRHNRVATYIVRQAIRMIERLNELRRAEEESEDE